MPSPDATYYNLKRLHAVFALSAVALLGVTVWMLAADHWREWKGYQRTYLDQVEPWFTEARLREQQSGELRARETVAKAALTKARSAVPPRELVERFRQEAQRGGEASALAELDAAWKTAVAAPGEASRDRLLAAARKVVESARRIEDLDARNVQMCRARFEEARSAYEGRAGQGEPADGFVRLQQRVAKVKADLDRLTARWEEVRVHQERLAGILADITHDEDAARAELAECRAASESLEKLLQAQKPSLAKRIARLPVIDALGRTLSVRQIWLPELTIDYNFRRVARFDRCTTCHLGIDKSVVDGSAASGKLELVKLRVPAVGEKGKAMVSEESDRSPPTPLLQGERGNFFLRAGLVLAEKGMIEEGTPTVEVVLTGTAAAQAGLLVGDVIVSVNGVKVAGRAEAERRLAAAISTGKAWDVEVRRGLPEPFRSHPRLDLFVGAKSPHPMAEFGCTICHAGQGSATAFQFASHTPDSPAERSRWEREHGWSCNYDWDYPMRPKRFAESGCLQCHYNVSELEPSRRFPDPPAAKLVAGYQLVRQLGCFGCHEIRGITAEGDRVGPDLRLESGNDRADPAAGSMRKVGPTLRGLAGKLDAPFIESWLPRPTAIRPGTRMPQFFGLHEHLEGRTLADARRFEAVEIRAITEYLLTASPAVPPLDSPAEVTEPASVERGKQLFLFRGCLACHKHKDFPQGESTVGPELSNLGAKLRTPTGKKWLASWLRDPARYSPRTLMPNPLLEPIPLPASTDGGDSRKARKTDPVADLAAYLLANAEADAPAGNASLRGLPGSANAGSSQNVGPLTPDPSPARGEGRTEAASARGGSDEDLDDLALLHLVKTFPRPLAEEYLRAGVPVEVARQTQADTGELVGPPDRDKKLRYVGRRTIAKRGCYGCHDIPGFENAAPIGPALSDWGRKQESLLAFEQVNRFVAKEPITPDTAFYRQALEEQRREGFLWQKLRATRSFDYRKAENKTINEHLLMGRFTLTDAQREAIATFVLGLTGQCPPKKYVYQPAPRQKALVEGRAVLDKYGCANCHTLEMERWQFQYDPQKFPAPNAAEDFAFMTPTFAAEQLAASKRTDRRGRGLAEVVGMPRVDASGKPVTVEGDEEDEKGDPIPMLGFALWEPAAINGEVWRVGGADLLVNERDVLQRRPPWGGDFARRLYPEVLTQAKASGSTAGEQEAWGWLPPPLVGEGARVQPAWLYGYLLDPTPIRPAAVLRMPKFRLSADEATKLVDYFAAASGAEFPYAADVAARSVRRPADASRQDAAWRLLTDRKTYCAKCHLIGDFSPGGDVRTVLAPNLEQVAARIRPEYIRRWLANPKGVLPYTPMPVNFPPAGPPLGQDLLPGSSLEQLDAVVDLLIRYDEILKQRTSVRSLIDARSETKPAAAADKK